MASFHPELVSRLKQSYDLWFADVMKDWRQSRQVILDHDRKYWKDRPAPDARALFKDFWQWQKAPKGTDPNSADPLRVFRGDWDSE